MGHMASQFIHLRFCGELAQEKVNFYQRLKKDATSKIDLPELGELTLVRVYVTDSSLFVTEQSDKQEYDQFMIPRSMRLNEKQLKKYILDEFMCSKCVSDFRMIIKHKDSEVILIEIPEVYVPNEIVQHKH